MPLRRPSESSTAQPSAKYVRSRAVKVRLLIRCLTQGVSEKRLRIATINLPMDTAFGIIHPTNAPAVAEGGQPITLRPGYRRLHHHFFNRRHNSTPSMRGIIQSVTVRLGFCVTAVASAISPFNAVTAWYPSRSRNIWSAKNTPVVIDKKYCRQLTHLGVDWVNIGRAKLAPTP